MPIEKIELSYPEWERQQGETNMAFEAFVLYRNMGINRNYRHVVNAMGKTGNYISVITSWASKYRWQERIAKYLDYLNKIQLELDLKDRKEMYKRHAQHAMAIETALMTPVQDFLRRYKNNEINFSDILADQYSSVDEKRLKLVLAVAEKIAKVVDIERISRGEPTAISQQSIDHTSGGDKVKSININVVHTKDDTIPEDNE